ncbi:hypothetical protein Pint_35008 [Pistacia integerrima]|uniref:Uncharacterized protein n=1 Tax=Pistacia integerrima TaxID=434235 RepID=A0ACC0Y0A2_9ROSI|nr:hypothetical protein Pint_35008 [Pistacia integerrima]
MFFLFRTIEANLCRLPIAMAGKTNVVRNCFKGSRTSSCASIQFGTLGSIQFGTLRSIHFGTLMFIQGPSDNFLLIDESKIACNYREFNSGKMGIDRNIDSSQLENSSVTSSMSHQDVHCEGNSIHVQAFTSSQSHSKREMDTENEDFSEGSPNVKQFPGRKKRIDLGSERRIGNVDSSQPGNLSVSSSKPFRDKGKPKSTRVKISPYKSCSKHGMDYKKLDSFEGLGLYEHGMSYKKLDSSKGSGSFNVGPFDICVSRSRRRHYIEDKESHNEEEQIDDSIRQKVLRPGMVLLKQYLSLTEQIEIVKTCQELGKGPGGFYQPGYKGGGKLRLQMMCLGLDWDPQTRKYEKQRRVDGCEPPHIPQAFNQFVQRAISDAHALIKKELLINVEDILPAMSPNICIVNFYNTSGRLGLHQDRDESRESLWKGLPVVSFSIGDSAEFLYGDERDIAKSETIDLESGDVLIFGGESRHIFHAVSSIIPNSAPGFLLEQSNLRPGRLNLTFRQY